MRTRKRPEVQARHREIMRLRRVLHEDGKPLYTLAGIGLMVGGLDHTTVLHHVHGACTCNKPYGRRRDGWGRFV